MIEKQLAYKFKVYELLKEDIINGVYPQGCILNERKLSQELGISRTPIREALQLLQRDGWVMVEAYKGSVVRTFDAKYIKSVLKVRQALEVIAVEDATMNVSDDDITYLENLLEKQEQSFAQYEPVGFIDFDREMHRKIYMLSDNEVLINSMENINDVVKFLGIKALLEPRRKFSVLIEHQNIVKCMKERNAPKAKEAMEKHMVETARYTLNHWLSASHDNE